MYIKWLSRENYLGFKINVSLEIKRLKKDYFKEARKYGVMTSKEFWKKLKPFHTNKGCFLGDQISTMS